MANLRECIKRNIEYTVVTYIVDSDKESKYYYYFYGKVSKVKAIKTLLKKHNEIVVIEKMTIRKENRYITLEEFIKYSKEY